MDRVRTREKQMDSRTDAVAATDAAVSLAFAAGIKERKETGNAE